MQKELNKKLKLDSINWVEVIEGLEGKTSFSSYDIKRALRKTGRSFNDNGPFHAVVKSFIEALGTTVSKKMVSSEVVYTISSTEAAIKAVSPKKKITAIKKTAANVCTAAASAGFGSTLIVKKKTQEEPTPVEIISDEDKIKDLFKKSYTSLESAIYLLAVYVKHAETSLSSKIIKTEISDLGVNSLTFTTSHKPVISEIFRRLGFNTLTVIKAGPNGSIWKLEGQNDLLDEYTHLADIYEKLTGNKSKNLDDYITTNTSKVEVERRYELLKEIEEKQKAAPREPRSEKNQENVWKKWLLISSSKNALGASRSISSLVSWIKSNRHYDIDGEEAEKLYHELMEDSEGELRVLPSNQVSLTQEGWERLSKFYSPTKLKETILVKLPLSLEDVSNAFHGLVFQLDDTTTSGMYLYTVEINRSMTCEIALKKLLRFTRLMGKIYTKNSWMMDRVMDIVKIEDSEETSKNSLLLNLEK